MRATLPFHHWVFAPHHKHVVKRTEMANQNATNQQSLRIIFCIDGSSYMAAREKIFSLYSQKSISSTLYVRQILIYFLSKNVNDLQALISSYTNAWLAKPRLFRTYDCSSEFCVEISMIPCARVDAHATYSCFK